MDTVHYYFNIYRITAVLKVEIDIITNNTERPIARVVILVIMYVETFKPDIVVFYRLLHDEYDITLTDHFQYHS